MYKAYTHSKKKKKNQVVDTTINNRPIAAIPEEPTDTYQQGSLNVTLDWWNRHNELQHWKSLSGKILISASFIDRADHVQRLK